MTRTFWQLFGLAFSAVVGGAVWLVAHMLDADPVVAVASGVAAFLGLAASMAGFLSAQNAPDEPHMRDPWDDGREILHQEHVPAILHRTVGPDDQTQILNAADLYRYKGRRRLKAGERS